MIDIENDVFNLIAKSLREKYGVSNIFITGEYVAKPTQYPAVTITESDNASYERTEDTGSNENHVSVMYEVNVYSNLAKGRKSQCKEIIGLIDEKFLELGFRRRTLTSVQNEDGNGTIYRMLGRYSAVVSKDKVIYKR